MSSVNNGKDNTKRDTSELKTLHCVLEPELRDIYVEGNADVVFYSRFMRELNIPFANMYAVDARLDISSDPVLALGQEVSAKGRLIALAAEVETWENSKGITCIVDRDYDCLKPLPDYDALFKTDFASRDLYMLQPRPLSRFIELSLNKECSPEKAQQIIDDIVPVLNELYLVRAALHLTAEVGLVERFMSCCVLKRGTWTVDSKTLVARSLGKAEQSALRGRVLTTLAEFRRALPEDLRHAIRGHDMAFVLAAHLSLKNDHAKPVMVEGMWAPAVGVEDVAESELFDALRRRLS